MSGKIMNRPNQEILVPDWLITSNISISAAVRALAWQMEGVCLPVQPNTYSISNSHSLQVYSLTEKDVMINCTNKDDQIVVQLPPTARCVSVVVRGENGIETPSSPHYFSPVVESGQTCQGRELTANLWRPVDLVNASLVISLLYSKEPTESGNTGPSHVI
eukprot:sb/3472825/